MQLNRTSSETGRNHFSIKEFLFFLGNFFFHFLPGNTQKELTIDVDLYLHKKIGTDATLNYTTLLKTGTEIDGYAIAMDSVNLVVSSG